MGGFGSGRQDGRPTVESCRSLNVNRLHAAGCLSPGWSGGWRWARDGEPLAWISLRAEEGRVVLSYRCRFAGGEWQDVEEAVRIARVPCRFGGGRPYFLCPGMAEVTPCGRRVIKLYGAGRYFLPAYAETSASLSSRQGIGGVRTAAQVRRGSMAARS